MTQPDVYQRSLERHRRARGKLATAARVPLETTDDLALAYSPGVARVSEAIATDPAAARELTGKGNSVAVVTDGSAVLGLGDVGPLAALPVMEGKAVLFKRYADLDAWPLCLDAREPDAIVAAVRALAPGFGGINLEDISAPRCFEVEERLQDLGVPVVHDDQHGTAIVVLAALVNAARVTGRELSGMRVVVNGAGAAGTAIGKLLRCVDVDADCAIVGDVVVCDRAGAIHAGRDDLPPHKRALAAETNRDARTGSLRDVLEGADAFIGVSVGDLLGPDDVRRMAPDPILFALANPTPEIAPDRARAGGAAVVGTGRSDHPNQVNNVLVFPGLFRGAIDARAARVDVRMKLAAARALADAVGEPSPERVLPSPLDPSVARAVAEAVRAAAPRAEARP